MSYRMSKLLMLAACSLSLSMTACQKSGGGEANDFVNDSLRSMSEPRFQFNPTGQKLVNADIDRDGWDKFLKCEDASTEERLDKEKYSTSVTYVTRSQLFDSRLDDFDSVFDESASIRIDDLIGGSNAINMPKAIAVVTKGYSTDDSGVNYTRSNIKEVLQFGSENFLAGGPYGITESCASDKCSEDSTKYTGEPMYGVTAQSKMNGAPIKYLLNNPDFVGCRFDQDDQHGEPDVFVEEGTVQIGSQTYGAVRTTVTAKGKVECTPAGEKNYTEVGEATLSGVTVVLADKLPKVRLGVSASLGQSCSRTAVFSSNTVKLNSQDNILFGMAKEVANFSLVGEVTPLEEWEAKKDEIETTLANKRQAVLDAEAFLAEKRAAEASAKDEDAELKAKAIRANEAATITAVKKDHKQKDEESDEDYEKRVQEILEARQSEYTVAQRLSEAAGKRYEIAQAATKVAVQSLDAKKESLRAYELKIAREEG